MIRDLSEYYLRWYHQRPVAITSSRREELERLHKVLYKCSEHLALNHGEYTGKWIPLGEKELEILDYQDQFPFMAGTWRPDYIIGEEGSLRICEITSRFFAHGIFMSRFAEEAADRFMARFPGIRRESRYPALMEYMASIAEGRKDIFVFKSSDKTNEIRLYKEFYENLGHRMTILEADEVEDRRRDWAAEGTFLISALNQRDILSFGMDTIRAMADKGMYSDFRNIFLLHDKRFMRLWFEDSFTDNCLTTEETAFLRSHAIPTWDCEDPQAAAILEDARSRKDSYILKPYRLGKSEGIKVGPLSSEEEWRSVRPEGMVIQPFIRQRTYRTEWEGNTYEDYLCGMMLCVNDRYFGSGMFRASSLPVTNVGDDRKACPLLTDDLEILEYCDVL
ncbi:MAG: hypothetical protein IJ840_07130 [Bacteroidales bacterium]|nr:hypothetical protein [Bacteroidales bacterium]